MDLAFTKQPSPYAPPMKVDKAGRSPALDHLLTLTSLTRRVERSLSGSFTTETKRAEARELLVQIVKTAWALRRCL